MSILNWVLFVYKAMEEVLGLAGSGQEEDMSRNLMEEVFGTDLSPSQPASQHPDRRTETESRNREEAGEGEESFVGIDELLADEDSEDLGATGGAAGSAAATEAAGRELGSSVPAGDPADADAVAGPSAAEASLGANTTAVDENFVSAAASPLTAGGGAVAQVQAVISGILAAAIEVFAGQPSAAGGEGGGGGLESAEELPGLLSQSQAVLNDDSGAAAEEVVATSDDDERSRESETIGSGRTILIVIYDNIIINITGISIKNMVSFHLYLCFISGLWIRIRLDRHSFSLLVLDPRSICESGSRRANKK